jgi:hypothetical protein
MSFPFGTSGFGGQSDKSSRQQQNEEIIMTRNDDIVEMQVAVTNVWSAPS